MATDLADYLVEKGVPFRDAHRIAGRAVLQAATASVALDELPLEVYQALEPTIDAHVYSVFDPEQSVARRATLGGTAPQAVAAQLEQARRQLAEI
jgi:argininosuccinate lyase